MRIRQNWVFESVGTGVGRTYASTTARIRHTRIEDNQFVRSPDGDGVCADPTHCRGHSATATTLAFGSTGGCSGLTIASNLVVQTSSRAGHGIVFGECDDLEVLNNTVLGGFQYGFIVEPSADSPTSGRIEANISHDLEWAHPHPRRDFHNNMSWVGPVHFEVLTFADNCFGAPYVVSDPGAAALNADLGANAGYTSAPSFPGRASLDYRAAGTVTRSRGAPSDGYGKSGFNYAEERCVPETVHSLPAELVPYEGFSVEAILSLP